jgi:hypothetical protein
MNYLPVKRRRTPSGWFAFNCVLCDDRRKRAGIIESGVAISYHCFNCSASTGWQPGRGLSEKFKTVAQNLGCPLDRIQDTSFLLFKAADSMPVLDTVFDHTGTSEAWNRWPPVELPDNPHLVVDLDNNHPIKEYANSRGLLDTEHASQLIWCDSTSYRKRLLIPFVYDSNIVGWAARWVGDKPHGTPKYLGETPPGFVYNIDGYIKNNREIVVVVEGVMDAQLTGAVSVLGNEIAPEQETVIRSLAQRVIVCPDRDASGLQLIDQAIVLGWEVSFPPWHPTCKDAADAVGRYGKLATLHSIIKHSTGNAAKITVMKNMQDTYVNSN